MEPHRSKSRLWWPVAASVMLLGSAAFLFRRPIRYRSHRTACGETSSVRLSEGTLVTLNANSTLWVPRWGFGPGSRRVLLEGEAEFRVSHTDDDRHFLVKTDAGFEVEVLGTEFMVYTRQRGNHVLLSQGEVQVNYRSGRKVSLRPGELLRLGADAGHSLVTRAGQSRYTAWKRHQFHFDDTPLSEVAVLVRERFGVKVVIDDPITADRRIAGIFQAKDADQLLEAVTTRLDLEMVRNGDSVSLHATNPD